MKKIDLHIHTVPTKSDASFSFDQAKLAQYVISCDIDAIAITNHNMFDLAQYRSIVSSVSALVIPGIEIDLESGHLIVLADPNEVVDFDSRCQQVTAAIPDPTVSMRLDKLQEIFPDLARYLLIPHYDKKPSIPSEILHSLRHVVTTGEVTSPKKFIYAKKDINSLVPVFFSDTRFDESLSTFPIRQTYVNIGEVTFSAIKYALADRHKVFLTQHSGHNLFQANDQGLTLSTGLNVVIGERSSGKSYTLNRLEDTFERVKYIRQFSLVERSDTEDSDRFNQVLRQKQSLFVQEYLKEFKLCIDDVSPIDLEADERQLEQYLNDLVKHALDYEKADAFSKAALFSESEFSTDGLENLKMVIESAKTLADNEEFRKVIEKHVPISALISLAVELMELFCQEKEAGLKKACANDLIATIKAELQRRTAVTPIPEIDLFSIYMNRERVKRFREVALSVRQEKQIFSQEIQGFRIVAHTRPFAGAGELKSISGRQMAFSQAFQTYDEPYAYLRNLRSIDGLPASEYHKFFTAIEYKIKNRYGFDVSGGERSEFRLLQEIADALQFDMLLIDEPESSFDNLFLNTEVNQLIKYISQTMPVVIVTHNSTVGASIKPDYLVYTKRFIKNGEAMYAVYCGHPTDKNLRSADGSLEPNHQVILNCLEAGTTAYNERGYTYETLKN